MDLGLAGKTAVVTGAGKGIGLAITRALAAEGARVVAGNRSVTPDLEELAKKKEVESVGGVAYIASLTEGLPRRVSIEEYVRIVKDKSLLRQLIHVCNKAITQAADQSEDALEVLNSAESAMLEVSERGITRDFLNIPAIVKEHFGTAEEPKPEFARFAGYFNIDSGTGNWKRSLSAVRSFAQRARYRARFFVLELNDELPFGMDGIGDHACILYETPSKKYKILWFELDLHHRQRYFSICGCNRTLNMFGAKSAATSPATEENSR